VLPCEQRAPTQPPLALSAGRLDVTLLLPIGSEPGPHDVRLLASRACFSRNKLANQRLPPTAVGVCGTMRPSGRRG